MALDFPNSPTNGQTYAATGLTWVWDGVKWVTGTPGTAGQPMMVVNYTQALPAGFRGFVRVENNTNAPITITLPASPVAAQEITLKDTYGNASTYPITIIGNGPLIDDMVEYRISYDYGNLGIVFTGAKWGIM